MEKPIRVLQVVTHMNRGGLETMLMNYYRNIDRSKIQFDFLTHREYDGDYGDEIKQLGGNIYHLPSLNPLSIKYKKEVRMFFLAHPEYKIIHVHQDCMSGVVLKIAMQCGVPVRIAHSHSSSQDRDWKFLIKLICKKNIKRYATSLAACGEEAGEWMFGTKDFVVINNAINVDEYSFKESMRKKKRKEFGVGENELLIGHVGRFSYPKNHDFLLDIFNNFQNKNKNSKLILVGDGELREIIEKKIIEYKIEKKVIITGLRSDVNELLQAMDVLVFPSLYEGFPVTIIEAQTAGLPCLISSNVPIECKKTDLVMQLSLDDIQEWCEVLDSIDVANRRDYSEEILKCGFDIGESAKNLETYYMSRLKK